MRPLELARKRTACTLSCCLSRCALIPGGTLPLSQASGNQGNALTIVKRSEFVRLRSWKCARQGARRLLADQRPYRRCRLSIRCGPCRVARCGRPAGHPSRHGLLPSRKFATASFTVSSAASEKWSAPATSRYRAFPRATLHHSTGTSPRPARNQPAASGMRRLPRQTASSWT